MAESLPESLPNWTCDRCNVTVRWMAGHERSELPDEWIDDEGQVYCLACRREIAAEAGLAGAPEDTTAKRRAELKAGALVEFELKRDPERPDGEIARALRTSVAAVLRARQRLAARS
jgi:hypothetical protein